MIVRIGSHKKNWRPAYYCVWFQEFASATAVWDGDVADVTEARHFSLHYRCVFSYINSLYVLGLL